MTSSLYHISNLTDFPARFFGSRSPRRMVGISAKLSARATINTTVVALVPGYKALQ